MQTAATFLNLVLVGFVSLFPPVNPLGTAFIVDPFLSGLDRDQRKAAAFKIAFYCFVICGATIVAGSWIFQLFGISLPIVQVAGGILICRMGWQLLSSDSDAKDSGVSSNSRAGNRTENLLFYPLAFPMTTGAGTISVLLTLSAHSHDSDLTVHLLHLLAIFLASAAMCVLVYVSYAFTSTFLRRLGPRGEQVINRLSAFLVFCVGLQIASTGLAHLISKT